MQINYMRMENMMFYVVTNGKIEAAHVCVCVYVRTSERDNVMEEQQRLL